MRDPDVGAPARPKGVQGKVSVVARDLTALGGAPRAVAPSWVSKSFLQSTGGAVCPRRHAAWSCAAAAFLVNAFLAVSVRAQSSNDLPAPPAKVVVGDAEASETIHLGKLKPEETTALEIKLINTGDSPLRFERAMGSCYCIKGTVTSDPIQPGESATVNLTMQAIIQNGIQTKELYVFAEGYKRPTVIRVDADVVDPDPIEKTIKFEPASLNGSYVLPGVPAVHEVLLRNTGMNPIEFARVTTTCTCVRGALLDQIAAPGEAARLKVTIEGKDIGPLRQTLTVWFSGARRPLELVVTADVTQAIKVDPFYINLAAPPTTSTDGSIPMTGEITLTAIDNEPFRVLSAGGAAPQLAPGDDNTPAVSHVVRWDFSTVSEDKLDPWWLIETDHPVAPVLDVRVIHPALIRKMVASEGRWSLSPDRVVIPEIKPGGEFERTIKLLRVKSDVIESISTDTPLLSVSVVNQVRTAGGVEATVRFKADPKASGLIRTNLTVVADGAGQSSYLFVRIAP